VVVFRSHKGSASKNVWETLIQSDNNILFRDRDSTCTFVRTSFAMKPERDWSHLGDYRFLFEEICSGSRLCDLYVIFNKRLLNRVTRTPN